MLPAGKDSRGIGTRWGDGYGEGAGVAAQAAVLAVVAFLRQKQVVLSESFPGLVGLLLPLIVLGVLEFELDLDSAAVGIGDTPNILQETIF